MSDKVLLVLGGSSDVGLALIKEMANQYSCIVAHYSKSDKQLIELKKLLGEKLILMQADFTKEEEIYNLAEKLKNMNLYPTHIVDFASPRYQYIKFSKIDWQSFEMDINVSLRSLIIILNAFLPIMAKNRNGKVVVMLTSCTKNIPPKYLSIYVTCKYAMLGLIKSLAQEYAGKGITINGISPSMIETKFLENVPSLIIEQNAANSPTGKNLMVNEVVPLFKFLLSDEANAITGQNIAVTNGN